MSLLKSISLNALETEKLVRNFEPGDTIVHQGKPGKTMFIIVEGFVRILLNSQQVDHIVGILGPGEVFGEKAILDKKPYNRNFSAQAKTAVTLLEIDTEALKTVLTNWSDFHMRLLRMIEDRLDKANELVGILQSSDPLERFIEYILYFHNHHSKKLPKGMYITMTAHEIQFAVNLKKDFVEECLKKMVEDRVLSPIADGYVLLNIDTLQTYIPKLKKRMAA